MIVIAQVRLTSHFLGELKPDDRGVRRFKTNDRGQIAVNQIQWWDDMTFAARNMKLDVNVRKTVTPPEGILPASIHLHRRVFSGASVEFFESFRKGAVLTFDMLLRDEKPQCPSLEQLTDILKIVGQYCGISQWGKKFGFGRFEVIRVNDRFANGQPLSTDKMPASELPPPTTAD